MNPLQIVLITSVQVLASIRWVDEADGNGPIDMDIFFDRVVLLGVDKKVLENLLPSSKELGIYNNINSSYFATGVFLSKKIILTTFNPFRNCRYDNESFPENFDPFYAMVLISRTIVEPKLHTYDIKNVTIVGKCRPLNKYINDPNEKQWHGIKKHHSPTHDLWMLPIAENLDFLEPDSPYSFYDYTVGVARRAGPMLTRYAKKGDIIGRDVKFASLGFRSKRHIKKNNKLSSRAYEEDENVVVDCEEWMPRYWGYFICIQNVDNYQGVGSGAILIYNNTLYGLGSFVLKKGNESILVFTDVRPYAHIFKDTCADPPTTTTTIDPDNATVDDYYSERDFL